MSGAGQVNNMRFTDTPLSRADDSGMKASFVEEKKMPNPPVPPAGLPGDVLHRNGSDEPATGRFDAHGYRQTET